MLAGVAGLTRDDVRLIGGHGHHCSAELKNLCRPAHAARPVHTEAPINARIAAFTCRWTLWSSMSRTSFRNFEDDRIDPVVSRWRGKLSIWEL